jgi:hypothetical protein
LRKRVILALFFFLLFFPLFLPSETFYYKSNSLGIAMEPVLPEESENFPYILKVEKERGREIHRLYGENKETKRWEYLTEPGGGWIECRSFSNGELTSHIFYSASARVREEHRYMNGELEQQIHYEYDRGKLSFVESVDGQDAFLYSERYSYTSSGLLRETVRKYAEGYIQIHTYRFDDNMLAEEIIQRGKEFFISRYDEAGRILEWVHSRGDDLIQKKEWNYVDGCDFPFSLKNSYLEGGTVIYTEYGTDGRIVYEKKSGDVEEEISYIRDVAGRLQRKIVKGGGGLEVWQYIYDESDEILQEDYYNRGELSLRRIYTAFDMWYEELYREDELFLRVFYEKDEKVREVFISKGQVVREREYRE